MGNENITMAEIAFLARETGLSNYIASEEKGYDTMLDPTGKRVSKHIKQKIKLIRALAGKPVLLLLEDPLNDLTLTEKHNVMKYLKNKSNATVIIISEDEIVRLYSNTFYEINEGVITT